MQKAHAEAFWEPPPLPPHDEGPAADTQEEGTAERKGKGKKEKKGKQEKKEKKGKKGNADKGSEGGGGDGRSTGKSKGKGKGKTKSAGGKGGEKEGLSEGAAARAAAAHRWLVEEIGRMAVKVPLTCFQVGATSTAWVQVVVRGLLGTPQVVRKGPHGIVMPCWSARVSVVMLSSNTGAILSVLLLQAALVATTTGKQRGLQALYSMSWDAVTVAVPQ
jgi:hypothetical protein